MTRVSIDRSGPIHKAYQSDGYVLVKGLDQS